MSDPKTVRQVALTRAQRATLRRLVIEEARRQGYGKTYHDDRNYPGGPHEWPDPLRRLRSIMTKLRDHNIQPVPTRLPDAS